MNNRHIQNPQPQLLPEGENAQPLETIGVTATASDKMVIIMVGLPGSGKTHFAKRICRFLEFFHDIPSQIFNTSDYRRKMIGTKLPPEFFDHDDQESVALREKACNAAMDDLIKFMKSKKGVCVGVYDSSNSKRSRRMSNIRTLVENGIGAKVLFIENIVHDMEVMKKIISSHKINTPDFKDLHPQDAVREFNERREYYEKVYQTLEDEDGSYIKNYDFKKFVIHNVRGYLPLKVCHFVMNVHSLGRSFHLTRHGQSEYNVLGKIGGDSSLSKAGVEYARRLAKYAHEVIAKGEKIDADGNLVKYERPCRLWTSTLKRTKETAQFFKHERFEFTWDNGDIVDWVQFRPMQRRNLDELYAGTCDGMTYKEIEAVMPLEFEARQKNKLSYRYPRGESYMDVTLRLEPLAHELERTREPLLIIGHQGILRIVYAYFMNLKREDAPYVSIPLNTIIKLSPHAYGCNEERICLMEKSEMFNDGQDEPITSMPISKSEDDPVMDAPSC